MVLNDRGTGRREELAAALHELAHAIAEGFPDECRRPGPADPLYPEWERMCITDAIRRPAHAAASPAGALLQYLQHGPRWHRAALHLHYRSRRLGYELPLGLVIGELPAVSVASLYRIAL